MRSLLRPSGLICLTVCFVGLLCCITAVVLVDRTTDLLSSCLNGEVPVTTIEAGDDHVNARCWTSTEPAAATGGALEPVR